LNKLTSIIIDLSPLEATTDQALFQAQGAARDIVSALSAAGQV